jgi:integrase
MLTSGRKRGDKPGTPLGARSVRLTLGRLSAAFELGVRDRKVTHKVCGLRWEDVDLAAGTITIAQTRPVVEGTVIVKAPKSQRGI